MKKPGLRAVVVDRDREEKLVPRTGAGVRKGNAENLSYYLDLLSCGFKEIF